jgi:hypothetical protein
MKSARLSVYLSELGPLIRKRVLLPPLSPRGETHSLAGDGGPNSNQGTDTLVLYVYYNPPTLANTAFVNFLCVSLEIYGIPYMKKVTEFREISRNYTSRNSAEFRRNCSQFRTEYGIDGSKKSRRNSVSAEFRGHPTWRPFFLITDYL